MKPFHRHRKCQLLRIYNVEEYLTRINHIKDKKDIKIVRLMKKWAISKTINMLQVINANIQNPILNELFVKIPTMVEEIEQ
jgi:hypothetical protein